MACRTVFRPLRVSCTAAVFAAICPILNAQPSGELSGHVTDGRKGISGVKVQMVALARSSFTDTNGDFVLKNVPYGSYTLVLTGAGWEPQQLPVSLHSPEQHLGDIELLPADYLRLSDADLSADEGANQRVSARLQASRDVFLRTVAYQFRPYWFALRGYDSRFNTVLLNGVVMNDPYDGRPNWTNWGGLNDVTRHPEEIKYALQPSDYTFSSLGTVTAIDTRAADYPEQLSLSFSICDYAYRQRVMVTYSSGLLEDGWALILSGSRRWAQKGRVEGTSYDAWAYFLGLEKRFTPDHSVSLAAMGSPTQRSGDSPNTRAVWDLKGKGYNAYWGWQNGFRRNARMRSDHAPILQLTDYWCPSKNLKWMNTLSYRFGYESRSRLETYKAPNPAPTYYRRMPAYFLSVGNPRAAESVRACFRYDQRCAQIDWRALYRRNQGNWQTIGNPSGWPGARYTGLQAAYYLAEDRRDVEDCNWNSRISYEISEPLGLQAGFSQRYMRSESYRKAADLLGADFILDRDAYADTPQEADNDLRRPNRIVFKNDEMAYDYVIHHAESKAFARLCASIHHCDWFAGIAASHMRMYRIGKYQNGRYPNRSAGRSKTIHFTDYGLQGGVTLKFDGRHYATAAGLYQSLAPTIAQGFPDARSDDFVTPNLQSTRVYSGNLRYDYRSSLARAKASLYYTKFQDRVVVNRYYVQGLSNGRDQTYDEAFSDFVTAVIPDLQTQHLGLEVGIEARLSDLFSTSFVASVGQYTYANTPDLYLISDSLKGFQKQGKAYIEHYKLSGTPQQAYALGFSYESAAHGWIGIFGDYLSHGYIAIAPVLRSRAFVINPATQLPYRGLSDAALKKALRQERFPDAFVLNLSAGKTWRFRDYYLGITLSVHNALNNRNYITGGFESARDVNYPSRLADQGRRYPVFGPAYWYDRGTAFFLNAFIRLQGLRRHAE